MAKIVLISERIGFREVALKEDLLKQHYEVSTVTFKLDEINTAIPNSDAVLMFVGDNISSYTSALVFLKDQLIEMNCLFFIIGDVSYVGKHINPSVITQTYDFHFNKEQLLEDIKATILMRESRKYRILVIDDSGVTLRTVKGILDERYEVQVANSAINGIKCMSIKKPDLILLDYDMPVCNGKQALEMIRQDSSFADIPVFFLTGRRDRDTVMEVMELKPKGYILKSSGAEELTRVVDNFFAQLMTEKL